MFLSSSLCLSYLIYKLVIGTYVTAVKEQEIGWSDSGGGFSFVYPRPSYQGFILKSFFFPALSSNFFIL
jgi:hypothetical protein